MVVSQRYAFRHGMIRLIALNVRQFPSDPVTT